MQTITPTYTPTYDSGKPRELLNRSTRENHENSSIAIFIDPLNDVCPFLLVLVWLSPRNLLSMARPLVWLYPVQLQRPVIIHRHIDEVPGWSTLNHVGSNAGLPLFLWPVVAHAAIVNNTLEHCPDGGMPSCVMFPPSPAILSCKQGKVKPRLIPGIFLDY